MFGGSPILRKIGATRRRALRLRILRRVPPGTISKVRQSRMGARKPGRTICSPKAPKLIPGANSKQQLVPSCGPLASQTQQFASTRANQAFTNGLQPSASSVAGGRHILIGTPSKGLRFRFFWRDFGGG